MSETYPQPRERGEPPEGVVIVEDSPERLVVEYSPAGAEALNERDDRITEILLWRSRAATRLEFGRGDVRVHREGRGRRDESSVSLADVRRLMLAPAIGMVTVAESLPEFLQAGLEEILEAGPVEGGARDRMEAMLQELREGRLPSCLSCGGCASEEAEAGTRLPVLSEMSLETFAATIFDHPEIDGAWPDPWWELGDPVQVVEHLIRLFERPSWLLERYTEGQVAQGFRYLCWVDGPLMASDVHIDRRYFGTWELYALGDKPIALLRDVPRPAGEWIGLLVAERTGLEVQEADCGVLPFELRKRFFESFYPLFRDLFTRLADEGPTAMWWFWELLQPSEDPAIVQVILATMGRILALDDADCQMSVLNVLTFSDYPGRRELVEEFLRSSTRLKRGVGRAAKRFLRGE